MTNPPHTNALQHSHADPEEEPFSGLQATETQASALTSARALFGAARWSTNINRPPPPWLIPDFLQSQSIHVISAAKGCLKTWLGLSMMLSGIYGIPTLGMAPTRRYRSLYVGADSPRWDIRNQLRNILRAEGLKPVFPTEADSFLLPYGFKFTRPTHMEALTALVRAFGIEVLFIDVLLYAHDGLNENDNTDMGRLFELIKHCRDVLGLAVVLLHHHTKPSEMNPAGGARGAGTIIQACEHHYELRRRKNRVVTLHRDKVRGRETWESLLFRLDYPDNTSARLVRVEPAAPALVQAAVPPPVVPQPAPDINTRQVHILHKLASGPATPEALATYLNVSKATVYRLLSKMPELVRAGGTYSLPEAPNAPANGPDPQHQ